MNLQEHGIEIIRGFIPEKIIEDIKHEVANYQGEQSKHGIRNAEKNFSSIQRLISSKEIQEKCQEVLGDNAQLVRAIFFNKTPDKNWLVTWHQDKTISVNAHKEISGWGQWSVKDNVHHVQPELAVLNNMLTFRIHLDDTDETNGCLKVVPSSHKLGILKQSNITNIVENNQVLSCSAKTSDTLLMRPHLLHSSSKSTKPSNRRVVHLEFSNYKLPYGLHWT